MSDRRFAAPLAEQMASLKKTMHNRDKRRSTDRAERLRSSEDSSAPDHSAKRRKINSHLVPNATGGVQLGSSSGTNPVLVETRVPRCALCQASFKNAAEEQQHVAGPAHRKALARQQADQEQRLRLAKGREAASSAVEAAQWSSPDLMPPTEARPQQTNRGPAVTASKPDAQGSESNKMKQQQISVAKPAPKQTHAQLVVQLRQADESLTVGGWVPPSLTTVLSEAPGPQAAALQGKTQTAEPEHQLPASEAAVAEATAVPSETASDSAAPAKQGDMFGLQAYLSESDSEGSESGSDGSADASAGKDNVTVGPFF